jgi:hypothetical protein
MPNGYRVMNHIINKHEGHDPLVQKCDHEALDGNQAKKEWFKPHSKAYCQLEEILLNKKLKKDIESFTAAKHIEGFHIDKPHTPKMFHFGYYGLLARLYIAALHFNENANRSQAVNKLGKLQYQLAYSKARKGELVVKQIKVQSSTAYIDQLLDEVLVRCDGNEPLHSLEACEIVTPPPLSHGVKRVAKPDAIFAYTSRFGKRLQLDSSDT